MKLQIFAIFDAKAEAFLRPMTYPTAAHCRRDLAEVMQQSSGSPFVDYPEDFTLFHVGEFDDDTGEVQPLLKHDSLGNLLLIKNELKLRRQKNLEEAST
nr:MAG: nonstructural protein [Microvirus sp.]